MYPCSSLDLGDFCLLIILFLQWVRPLFRHITYLFFRDIGYFFIIHWVFVLHLDNHVLVLRDLINFIPFCYVFGPYGPIHLEVSAFNGLVLHFGWLSPSSSTLGDFLRFYKACGFKPPWDYVALGLLESLYLLTLSSLMYIVIHLEHVW